MEEKIYGIIDNFTFEEGYYGERVTHKARAAKEITAHVFEFIEWARKNVLIELSERNNYSDWFWSIYTDKEEFFTTEELYQYWLNNVKK